MKLSTPAGLFLDLREVIYPPGSTSYDRSGIQGPPEELAQLRGGSPDFNSLKPIPIPIRIRIVASDEDDAANRHKGEVPSNGSGIHSGPLAYAVIMVIGFSPAVNIQLVWHSLSPWEGNFK